MFHRIRRESDRESLCQTVRCNPEPRLSPRTSGYNRRGKGWGGVGRGDRPRTPPQGIFPYCRNTNRMDRCGRCRGSFTCVHRRKHDLSIQAGSKILRRNTTRKPDLVQLPIGARGGSRGKLTAVLDHRLRIGDAAANESIINAYKERGLQPPEAIEDPPRIKLAYFVYWEAYQDLQSERHTPRGAIPITAILSYAQGYGLDPDQLKRIVWSVDRVLLKHWSGIDEAEKRKADADRANKQTRGKS